MDRRQMSANEVPLEVRSRVDWAWYDGNVSRDGSKMRIHFAGFGVADDEVWDEVALHSSDRLTNLIRRRSIQLQDSDCRNVHIGMIVCALYRSEDGKEAKYFDAQVNRIDHVNCGEQRDICDCKFELEWQEGPAKTRSASVGCADLAFIDERSIDAHPVAGELLREARKFEKKCTPVNRDVEQVCHVNKNDTEELSPEYSERQKSLDVFLTKLDEACTLFEDAFNECHAQLIQGASITKT